MPDGSIHFFLQGKKDYLERALGMIRKGPKKASITSVNIDNRPLQNGITSVVVKAWTSGIPRFSHSCRPRLPLRTDDSVLIEGRSP